VCLSLSSKSLKLEMNDGKKGATILGMMGLFVTLSIMTLSLTVSRIE